MVQDFKKRENVIRRHFSQQERCVSQSGSSYKELIFKIFSTFKFQKKIPQMQSQSRLEIIHAD